MTKRIIKEAKVSLDLTDLQSSDLDTLSRILSLAGQAEGGEVDSDIEIADVSIDTSPTDIEEPSVSVVEPVDMEIIDSEESEDLLGDEMIIDSITEEISSIFKESEDKIDSEEQLDETLGGDMEEDYVDDIEDAEDSLISNIDEVETEMKESTELYDILSLSGLNENKELSDKSGADEEGNVTDNREEHEKRPEENTEGTGECIYEDAELDRILNLSNIKEGVIGEETLDIFGKGGDSREEHERRPEENTEGTGEGALTEECDDEITLEGEECPDCGMEECECVIVENELCNNCNADPCICKDGLLESIQKRWNDFQKGK